MSKASQEDTKITLDNSGQKLLFSFTLYIKVENLGYINIFSLKIIDEFRKF